MNINYHIETLKKSAKKKGKGFDHPITNSLIDEYERLDTSQAMEDYITTGDLSTYVNRINEYDKFIYEYARKGQASNPVSTRQNKNLSTWREVIWTPIWERLKNQLQGKTELSLVTIQNKKVLQNIFSTGDMKFKDVDGGIGIQDKEDKKLIRPLLIVEDKGGHADSTAMDGVQGQALQFSLSFPKSIFLFITDNNFSVGKHKNKTMYQNVNGVICERGENLKNVKGYNPVDHVKIQTVIDKVTTHFTSEAIDECWKNVIEIPAINSSGPIRKDIDQKGYYFNF